MVDGRGKEVEVDVELWKLVYTGKKWSKVIHTQHTHIYSHHSLTFFLSLSLFYSLQQTHTQTTI